MHSVMCGFLTKSFSDAVLKLQNVGDNSFKSAAKVWCKMDPPKVELLVWFLVFGFFFFFQ